MAKIKLVVWNMEWMNDLFVANDEPVGFRPDDHSPYHTSDSTIRQRRDDLSAVLEELNPDVVVIVEGPNRDGELQLFFDSDMPGEWVTKVQYSKGQSQNLGIAVRIDTGMFEDPAFKHFDTNNIAAFDPFMVDTDEDDIEENYKFERRPLYAELNPKEGSSFRILGLHLKSKGVFKSYEWSKWWQMADANRKKIFAQATHLRLNFLDSYLRDENTGNIPLIVCGDINDGPGWDASEKRLFGSGMERLMGTIWNPDLTLGNALFDTLSEREKSRLDFSDLYTTNFRDPIFNYTWHKVWIDHILYSRKGISDWVKNGQSHVFMEGGKPMWEKYPHASDHFPISADIEV